MRVLVTGGLGHIGSALIRNRELLESADEIVIIDDLSTQRYSSLFSLPDSTAYKLMVGNVAEVLKPSLLDNVDSVVHLAATADPGAGVADPSALFKNNLRTTRHVVECCTATETPLVFASSTSVYTPSGPSISEESQETKPTGAYAQCKLAEEDLILKAASDGLHSVVFRLGTIFGVSAGMRFHTAVNKFCWQAALGERIKVWRTALDQQRPYLDVDDAASVIGRAVTRGIYPDNLVNAVTCSVTVREVLDAMSEVLGTLEVELVDSPLMNSMSFEARIDRAHVLGFEFQGSLRSGVSRTIELLGNLGR